MTQIKNYWRTVVHTIMYICSAYKPDKFWTDRIIVTFSKRPLSYILMLVCRVRSVTKYGNSLSRPADLIFCMKIFVALLILSIQVPKYRLHCQRLLPYPVQSILDIRHLFVLPKRNQNICILSEQLY